MKCDLPQFWEEYRKKRNEVTSSIRLAKQEYVQGLLNEKAGNSSTLWSTIKHRSSNVKDSSIKLNIDGKDVVEPEMVAENLNNYFIDSVSELLHQEANGYDNNVDVSESIECPLQETNDDNFESSHSEEYDLPELTIEYLVKEIELLSTTKSTGSVDISVKILMALKGKYSSGTKF